MILSCSPLFSQEVDPQILDEIYEKGKSFTTSLKNGEIESLRNENPSKDTWLFSKLEEYKQKLGSNDIIYGDIILPSANANSNLYSYNLFVYDLKKEAYYFVAIVSYKITEGNVKLDNSFLFTEEKGLKDWWRRIFGFYQSEMIDNIPKKYLYDICPPPPFKD